MGMHVDVMIYVGTLARVAYVRVDFQVLARIAGVCTCPSVWYMFMFTFCVGDTCEHVHVGFGMCVCVYECALEWRPEVV